MLELREKKKMEQWKATELGPKLPSAVAASKVLGHPGDACASAVPSTSKKAKAKQKPRHERYHGLPLKENNEYYKLDYATHL